MIQRVVFILVILVFALAGCTNLPMDPASSGGVTPQTDPDTAVSSDAAAGEKSFSPLDPLPGEEGMRRGNASITESQLLIAESFPVQIRLSLKGTLPTPCHHLRAKVNAAANGKVEVEVYSLVNPDEICVQVLQEFETSIPLDNLDPGTYEVLLNGKSLGEVTQ